MHRLATTCFVLSAALAPAQAAATQEAATQNAAATAAGEGPLAAVQALFDAMAAHDTAAARALIAPGAQLLVVRPDGSVHAGKDEGFIEALGKDSASWHERSWNAEVKVDGPMAQVWAPYDFHHGGRFSHCGSNSVTLARGAAGWQVIAIAYTMRKDDCPPGAPSN